MPSSREKALAWSVHVFTASGLLPAFMAILAIGAQQFKAAMLWLLLCFVIDGVDGALARAFRAKEVLPFMDGKTIDYVIDFATYAIIPAYFFYEAQLVPPALALPCTFLMLLVSALYYGKAGMVSADMYFVGFPVLWNIVVFCLYFVFPFPPIGNALAVLFFAVLHFVPVKFVYPSQGQRFRWLTIGVSVLFFVVNGLIAWQHPGSSPWLLGLSYATIAYYAVLAVYNTWLEK